MLAIRIRLALHALHNPLCDAIGILISVVVSSRDLCLCNHSNLPNGRDYCMLQELVLCTLPDSSWDSTLVRTLAARPIPTMAPLSPFVTYE
jgi:hypothetical protein